MLSFQSSWVFALVILPLLARWLLPKKPAVLSPLNVPSLDLWPVAAQSSTANNQVPRWRLLVLSLIWLCLIGAAANPVWYGDPVSQQAKGRDVLLAVDISGSMRLEDMSLHGRRATRLQASKAVIADFAKARQGDRIGLILFGSSAYMHVPLTADIDTLITLLNEAKIGYAGRETAIGDAIGLGLKRLHKLQHNQRIMILLTDGSNSAGALDPIKAAELARDMDLTIYTIGVGSRQGLRSRFGSGIDETTLNSIANITGGQAFRAADTQQLQEIYRFIDQLEPTPDKATSVRPQRSFTWYLLLAALTFSGVLAATTIASNWRSHRGLV